MILSEYALKCQVPSVCLVPVGQIAVPSLFVGDD